MVTVSKKRTQLPPRDSWIELSPGESVLIDDEFQKKWRKETRDFREVRGNFLAGCFEIEYKLDLLLSEVHFPGLENPDAKPTDNVPLTIESGKVLKNLFDELILKGGSSLISFGFKIDLFKKLSSQIPAVNINMPEGFGNKLEYSEYIIIPDRELSLEEGAIEPWSKPSFRWWYKQFAKAAKKKEQKT